MVEANNKMINRYSIRKVLQNNLENYSEILRKRNVKFINQYETPDFSYVNASQYSNLTIIKHVWQEGDRYYKLAEKYYGDAKDWWIIAKFNLKPTESHIQVGDIIDIPTPLDKVLNYMTG
jgi:hypothetical protein